MDYDVSIDGQEFVHIRIGLDGTDQRGLVWILNWPEIVREMTSRR